MNMSRRLALACASAFAVTGGTTQSTFASAVKSAVKAHSLILRPNLQTAQSFLELLIHRDEAGDAPRSAIISIAAPDAAWYDTWSLEESRYRVLNHDYKKHGYRLRRLSAFNTKDGVRFAALWELTTGPAWESTHALPLAKFENLRNEFKQSGYRMTHIDARANYAAIWEKGDNSSQQVFTALTLLEYEQQYNILTGQGLRPTRISATAQNGEPFFAAIFDKATNVPWQAQTQMTEAAFVKANKLAAAKGYRLVDASGCMLSGKPSFSGTWEKAA